MGVAEWKSLVQKYPASGWQKEWGNEKRGCHYFTLQVNVGAQDKD